MSDSNFFFVYIYFGQGLVHLQDLFFIVVLENSPRKLGVIKEATLLMYVQDLDLYMRHYRVLGCSYLSLHSEDCAGSAQKRCLCARVLVRVRLLKLYL